MFKKIKFKIGKFFFDILMKKINEYNVKLFFCLRNPNVNLSDLKINTKLSKKDLLKMASMFGDKKDVESIEKFFYYQLKCFEKENS